MTGIRIRAAFVGGALALSGCVTGGGPFVSSGTTDVAIGLGTIAAMGDGLIGGAGAGQLDRDERRAALEAEYRALEYTAAGQPVEWRGSGLGRSGEVVAAQPYRVGSQDCRQYMHSFSLNGPRQTVRGTACRNPDGSWTPLT